MIGNTGDEFDQSRDGSFVSWADTLSSSRISLGLRATSIDEAVKKFIASIPRNDFPADHDAASYAVLQRKRFMPIYDGNGLAIPHGRLPGIHSPVLAFARCDEGIPSKARTIALICISY